MQMPQLVSIYRCDYDTEGFEIRDLLFVFLSENGEFEVYMLASKTRAGETREEPKFQNLMAFGTEDRCRCPQGDLTIRTRGGRFFTGGHGIEPNLGGNPCQKVADHSRYEISYSPEGAVTGIAEK